MVLSILLWSEKLFVFYYNIIIRNGGKYDFCFHYISGYNVTILAYGQTGSGKTYTMGTNYSGSTGDSTKLGKSH